MRKYTSYMYVQTAPGHHVKMFSSLVSLRMMNVNTTKLEISVSLRHIFTCHMFRSLLSFTKYASASDKKGMKGPHGPSIVFQDTCHMENRNPEGD